MKPDLLAQRYEITGKVLDGPLFTVYSARDRIGAKEVSVRVINQPYAGEEAFLAGLQEGIRVAQGVKHPGIERISSLEEGNGHVFLVGDSVRGMPLAERIRKLAPFSVPVAVGTAITICEALASLHRAGITHGDIGAHNVTVLPEGTAILQQAAIWTAYPFSRSAGPAVLPLMAPYLAPEISKGDIPTPQSDVYAAGVILFQLLTGQLPFQADQPVAMAMKHIGEPVPSARSVIQTIPVAIDEAIAKAMAKDRADRYDSAVEFLSDLRMIQDAIRFGRSLTWPLKEATKPDLESEANAAIAEAEKSRKAKMAKDKKSQVAEEDFVAGDVPGWVKGIIVFLLAILVMIVGSWLVQNLREPKQVVVPDLRRLTVANAKQAVKTLKLTLRVVSTEISESVPADVILDMDPTAGEKIREGGTINVKVSAGSRFVEVPDIRGMTVDQAKLLLESLGLKMDGRLGQEPSRDVEAGMIIEQVPEPRTHADRSTNVRVVISTGKRGRERPAAGSNSKYLYTIRIELSDIVEAVLMRVDMTDSRGTKTISEERREPGDIVELTAEGYGDQAIFKIFYDGEPITQIVKSAEEGEMQNEP